MNKELIAKILKIFVTFILITYILLKVDIENLLGVIKSAHIGLLIIAFLSNGFCIIIRVYKWKIILSVQEIAVPFKTLLTFSFTSGFFGLLLPTAYGGDFVRAYDVSKFSNKKLESVTSILVDRVSGALSLFLIASIASIFSFDIVQDISFIFIIVGMLLLISILILFVLFKSELPIVTKISPSFINPNDVLNKVYHTFHIYRYHKRDSIQILGLSLFAQFIAILYYPLISFSLGLNIPFAYFLIVMPIILVILMIPISVGGIGVREGAFIFFFKRVGVLPYEAVSMALVAFGLYLIWGVIGGIIYALRGPTKNESKADSFFTK